MSTLMRLFGSLWAAMWVRWQLLSLRSRRAVGDGRATAAGAGYELPEGEIPVEGVDYDLAELPDDLAARLHGLRTGLLDQARRTTVRPPLRRWRAVSFAVVAFAASAAFGAGAAALVAGSTGVPAVDRLLGIYEEQLSRPEASERGGPSGRDVQPSATKASEPIEIFLPDGSRSVTTFYVARNDEICAASVEPADENTGTLGCEPSKRVADDLEAEGVHLSGIDPSRRHVVLKGYVRTDIDSLRGTGPSGPLEIHLGAPWSPSAPAVASLRPFVAVGPGTADDAIYEQLFLPQSYSLEAMTQSGREIEIRP